MKSDRPATQRLFLALWPDDGTRERLAQAARQWSRRPVKADNLHMTLHFLGACTPEQTQCYREVVSRIVFEPFVIKLNYLGGWGRSRIQWLGASEHPEALLTLVDTLAEALSSCGYQPDTRPFVPHVTLSRNTPRPQVKADLPVIEWPVSDFVLAESSRVDGEVRYQVRQRWSGQA